MFGLEATQQNKCTRFHKKWRIRCIEPCKYGIPFTDASDYMHRSRQVNANITNSDFPHICRLTTIPAGEKVKRINENVLTRSRVTNELDRIITRFVPRFLPLQNHLQHLLEAAAPDSSPKVHLTQQQLLG